MATRTAPKTPKANEANSASAADRIQTPPFKPTRGITQKQIDKVIRDIMARRAAQPQS